MKRIILACGFVGLAACSTSGSAALDASDSASQPGSHVKVVALGPVRGDLALGLDRLQASVARCAATEAGRSEAGGEMILRLDIETLDRGLRVVDALPAGVTAPDAPAAACAREALRGKVMPSRLARAGTSFQMPFRMSPDAASGRGLALVGAAPSPEPGTRP